MFSLCLEAALLPFLLLDSKDIYLDFSILQVSECLASVFPVGLPTEGGAWQEVSGSTMMLRRSWKCESCFSELASKHTHLLPGKSSWIIILHFPNSQTLLLCTDPGSWPDYAVCLFTNNILPSSLCSRSLFTVSGVHSRPDDAVSSSPEAKTDISYSPTEFTAAEGKYIKALLKNKNK